MLHIIIVVLKGFQFQNFPRRRLLSATNARDVYYDAGRQGYRKHSALTKKIVLSESYDTTIFMADKAFIFCNKKGALCFYKLVHAI